MGVRYIGVKLSTGAIRHSKTRLAQTAGRGALEPRNSCCIYITRRRYPTDVALDVRVLADGDIMEVYVLGGRSVHKQAACCLWFTDLLVSERLDGL